MSNADLFPSFDGLLMLYRTTLEALRALEASTLAPSLQSTMDKVELMRLLYGLDAQTGSMRTSNGAPAPMPGRGWPIGTRTAIECIGKVTCRLVERWGLTHTADQKPLDGHPNEVFEYGRLLPGGEGTFPREHIMIAPDGSSWALEIVSSKLSARQGDPVPDAPLIADDEELGLLRHSSHLLLEALELIRPSAPVAPHPAPEEAGPRILQIPPRNEDRDAYIYEKRKQGVDFKSIISAIKNEHPSWEAFRGDSQQAKIDAARKAMVRYCQRHGFDVPSRDDACTRRN